MGAITKRILTLLSIMICLLGGVVPYSIIEAEELPVVNISAPAKVPQGGEFTARVNLSNVRNFKAYLIQINYNQNVIQVAGVEGGSEGVTDGLIDNSTIQVDGWLFYPAGAPRGSIRIAGQLEPPAEGVSGSGYLLEVHFIVLGETGQSSIIIPSPEVVRPSDNQIFDGIGVKIPSQEPWSGCQVEVYEPLKINTITIPEGEAGAEYSYNMYATGGLPPYRWEASGLPQGYFITNEGVIHGNTTQSDDFKLYITVTDSYSDPRITGKNYDLHVYPELKIETSLLPESTMDTAYSTTLVASGGISPYSWSSSNLPSGLIITKNGVIEGIPQVSGAISFNVTLTDALTPSRVINQSLAVNIYDAFKVETESLVIGVEGSQYADILLSRGGKAPYFWHISGLPSGLNFTNTGRISGKPVTAGDYNIMVTVVDSFSPLNIATRSLTLHVQPVLSLETFKLDSGRESQNYSGSLRADGGIPPYTWSASGLPPGLSLSLNGTVFGNPQISGIYEFNVQVKDALLNNANGKMTITILPSGDVNGDGLIDMRDVIKIQRILLLLDAKNIRADINGDNKISMVDVVWLEMIILRLP
jgi:hypothetical protein